MIIRRGGYHHLFDDEAQRRAFWLTYAGILIVEQDLDYPLLAVIAAHVTSATLTASVASATVAASVTSAEVDY